jgi:DNA-binding transcriptional regulator YiaG
MQNSISRDILDGLQDLRDVLQKGERVSDKLTVRKVKLKLKPTRYTPKRVQTTRRVLNVSQAVFAEFLGVSISCVRAWEQGDNPVSGAAARLMDEIRQDPEYWRRRVRALAKVRED